MNIMVFASWWSWMGGNPSGDPQSAPNPLVSFLPFILIIVVIYFLMIRPQKKRQKEHDKQVSALGKGDRIVTAGGLHGTVQSTKEKTLIVKIADNVKVEIEKSAVSAVITSTGKGEESEGKSETEAGKS